MQPTFSNRWDRLTFLLAEFKVLVSGLIIGAGAWLIYVEPSLPTLPPWVGATAIFWTVSGLPMYLVGVKFAQWLRRRNRVTVFHIDARQESEEASETDVEKYLVSPETWADKTVEDVDPYALNGGTAWGVQEFEHHEDTDKLIVKGVWLSEAQDAKMMSSRRHVDEVHDFLLNEYRRLSSVRDRVSRLGVEVQERVINASAAARERGEMLDTTAVKDAVDAATEDVPDPKDPPALKDLDAHPDDPIGDLSPGAQTNGHDEAATIETDGGEP